MLYLCSTIKLCHIRIYIYIYIYISNKRIETNACASTWVSKNLFNQYNLNNWILKTRQLL